MKRKHQQAFEDTVTRMIEGTTENKALLLVTPGGGKSALPIEACRLIEAGLADGVCIVVPRSSLQDQGERAFLDPMLRGIYNHNFRIRSSTNDYNPARGTHGFITTYQAIGTDKYRTVLREFKRRRYVLVLDEFHHVAVGGSWHEALAKIQAKAAYTILMTGTLARGDGEAIAFVDYERAGKNFLPITERAITYTRSDALAERAILPLQFFCHDGAVKWMTDTGREVTYGALSRVKRKDATAAIYTAVDTQYANDLMEEGVRHWKKHRIEVNKRSKILFVTANIGHAKKAVETLRKMGLRAEIATSHDTPAAHRTIKRYRSDPDATAMVTIAMAYEGFDCKPLTHVVCLTHIRSTPWIEQMVARAVRVDPAAGSYETQSGYIFCPDDPLFRDIITKIRAEQAESIKSLAGKSARTQEKEEQLGLFDVPKGPNTPGGIIPIGSYATSSQRQFVGIDPASSPDRASVIPIKTESELEEELRQKIDKYVKAYARNNRYKPVFINSELKERFGKAREEMTRPELERLLAHLEKYYRLDTHRGYSRPVPTKAMRIA